MFYFILWYLFLAAISYYLLRVKEPSDSFSTTFIALAVVMLALLLTGQLEALLLTIVAVFTLMKEAASTRDELAAESKRAFHAEALLKTNESKFDDLRKEIVYAGLEAELKERVSEKRTQEHNAKMKAEADRDAELKKEWEERREQAEARGESWCLRHGEFVSRFNECPNCG